MSTLICPSAPSIETIFVEGHRFDICEVPPEFDGYLAPKGKYNRPMARFYVNVGECHIVRYKYTVALHEAGCWNRWDMFCMGKAEAFAMITAFKTMLADYNRLVTSLQEKPMFKINLQAKIDFIKTRASEVYGVAL